MDRIWQHSSCAVPPMFDIYYVLYHFDWFSQHVTFSCFWKISENRKNQENLFPVSEKNGCDVWWPNQLKWYSIMYFSSTSASITSFKRWGVMTLLFEHLIKEIWGQHIESVNKKLLWFPKQGSFQWMLNSCSFDVAEKAISSRIVWNFLIWYEDGTLMPWELCLWSVNLTPLVWLRAGYFIWCSSRVVAAQLSLASQSSKAMAQLYGNRERPALLSWQTLLFVHCQVACQT